MKSPNEIIEARELRIEFGALKKKTFFFFYPILQFFVDSQTN